MWQAAITRGNYKLIWGQDYLLKKSPKGKSDAYHLFDVYNDPSEVNDVAAEFPDIVNSFKSEIINAKDESFVKADYPKCKFYIYSGNHYKTGIEKSFFILVEKYCLPLFNFNSQTPKK